MAYVRFIFICTVWGGSFILMKKASLALSPVEIAAWRVASGAVTLGLLSWWQRALSYPRRQDLGWMLFLVLIGYVCPFVLQPYLVSQHGSAFVGLTVSFVPLLTILVSIPILRVFPSPRQLAGVLGALACMGVLVLDGLRQRIPGSHLLLAGTVPLGYALCNTFVRKRLSHVGSLPLAFQSLAAASAILVPLSLTPWAPERSVRSEWLIALAAVLVLGVVGTGVATWLFTRLIQDQGPLFAGMTSNLVPMGAVLWGWLDQEQVSATQVAALVGIVALVSIVQYGAAHRAPSGRAASRGPS